MLVVEAAALPRGVRLCSESFTLTDLAKRPTVRTGPELIVELLEGVIGRANGPGLAARTLLNG